LEPQRLDQRAQLAAVGVRLIPDPEPARGSLVTEHIGDLLTRAKRQLPHVVGAPQPLREVRGEALEDGEAGARVMRSSHHSPRVRPAADKSP
jgi:hypothetical protein